MFKILFEISPKYDWTTVLVEVSKFVIELWPCNVLWPVKGLLYDLMCFCMCSDSLTWVKTVTADPAVVTMLWRLAEGMESKLQSSQNWATVTEQVGSNSDTSGLYLVGVQSESSLEHQLSWLKLSMVFFQSFQANIRIVPQLGRDYFVPQSLDLVFTSLSTIWCCYMVWGAA